MTSNRRIIRRSRATVMFAMVLFISGCSGSPTAPSDIDGSFVIFNSEAGDWVGAGMSRRYTPENATIRAVVGQAFGYMQVDINSRDRTEWWTLRMRAPGGAPLLPLTYEPATRWTPALAGSEAQLDFSGTGRGCGPLTGRFVVHTLKYGSLGEVERFRATFEQRCEGSSAALIGEISIVDGGAR